MAVEQNSNHIEAEGSPVHIEAEGTPVLIEAEGSPAYGMFHQPACNSDQNLRRNTSNRHQQHKTIMKPEGFPPAMVNEDAIRIPH